MLGAQALRTKQKCEKRDKEKKKGKKELKPDSTPDKHARAKSPMPRQVSESQLLSKAETSSTHSAFVSSNTCDKNQLEAPNQMGHHRKSMPIINKQHH